MRYLVKFIGVGRNKRSWQTEYDALSESALTREVRKSKALMSHGIDVILRDDQRSGEVIVGGFRCVGHIVVEDRNEQAISA